MNDCKKIAKCRGLCDGCYKRLQLAVKTGKDTWKKAESRGACKEGKQHNSATYLERLMKKRCS